MQRSDVVLAELADFLLEAEHSSSHNARIILAVSSEISSLLPCCKQSLGFKNAQVSKLWSSSHWKNDACKQYWKDVHLVCVRKYRPNSTYASVEEVKEVVGTTYDYLHELPCAVSPLRRVSSKTILGARTPAIATSNQASRTLRSVSSYSRLNTTSPRSPDDHPSPSQKPAAARTAPKPRASEPALPARTTSVRSPIVTRRRSNTALHAQKPSPSPQPPVPQRNASTARSPSAATYLSRKASDSSLAVKPRSGRISSGAPAPRSVSGSAIPTPVRRASLNLLESIAQGSPSSPTEHSRSLRASLRHNKPKPQVSVSVQTEPELNPPIQELMKVEEKYDQLKQEHQTTLAYTRELGLENQRLRKHKTGISEEESNKLKEQKKTLEGTIKELKRTNANLMDENGWIVICKTEQEEKTKQLKMENETLVTQFKMLSNQRKELEGIALPTREQLNDALEEISCLQVQAAAARMSGSPQYASTPMKTPVTRLKEAFDPVTVYKTPYLTPVKQVKQPSPSIHDTHSTPARRETPQIGSVSARIIRTPLTASAKKQKHGLRFWKRMAKRRMFA